MCATERGAHSVRERTGDTACSGSRKEVRHRIRRPEREQQRQFEGFEPEAQCDGAAAQPPLEVVPHRVARNPRVPRVEPAVALRREPACDPNARHQRHQHVVHLHVDADVLERAAQPDHLLLHELAVPDGRRPLPRVPLDEERESAAAAAPDDGLLPAEEAAVQQPDITGVPVAALAADDRRRVLQRRSPACAHHFDVLGLRRERPGAGPIPGPGPRVALLSRGSHPSTRLRAPHWRWNAPPAPGLLRPAIVQQLQHDKRKWQRVGRQYNHNDNHRFHEPHIEPERSLRVRSALVPFTQNIVSEGQSSNISWTREAS